MRPSRRQIWRPLRDYQREGLGWLEFLQRFGFGGCLADDMGLGKTIQVLALLESRRERRAQIQTETRASFARGRAALAGVSLARGSGAIRAGAAHSRTHRRRPPQSRRSFRRLRCGASRPTGRCARDALHFKDVRFDYCILDEAQAIKNAGTFSAKAARLLQRRSPIGLSGTPVENHLGELWSLFEFLNPGMLGGASVFGAVGRNPDAATRRILGAGLAAVHSAPDQGTSGAKSCRRKPSRRFIAISSRASENFTTRCATIIARGCSRTSE